MLVLPSPLTDVAEERYALLAELLISAADVSRTLFDEEGRPLGERYFPPRFRGTARFRLRPCSYSDSRQRCRVNVDALPAVVRNWEFVVSAIGALRRTYLAGTTVGAIRWIDLWFLGRIATAAPAFWVRRTGASRAIVPTALSALFKPSIGLYMTAERAFLHGANPQASPSDTEALAAVHHTKALLSADAACPASPRHLQELFAVALHGKLDRASRPLEVIAEGAPIDVVVRYGLCVARLELAKFVYFLDVEQRLARLTALGLLGPATYRPPNNLREVSVDADSIASTHSRLRAVAMAIGLHLPRYDSETEIPAQSATPNRGVDAMDILRREFAHDLAWTAVLWNIQTEVLGALGGPAEAPPITLDDLARIAAYLALDWRYMRHLNRYRIIQRINVQLAAGRIVTDCRLSPSQTGPSESYA